MKVISKTVNKTGLSEIARFISENHKSGGQILTDSALLAYAQEAEFQISEGNTPSIELKSWNSIHVRTQEFTISDAGIDSEEIELEDE